MLLYIHNHNWSQSSERQQPQLERYPEGRMCEGVIHYHYMITTYDTFFCLSVIRDR